MSRPMTRKQKEAHVAAAPVLGIKVLRDRVEGRLDLGYGGADRLIVDVSISGMDPELIEALMPLKELIRQRAMNAVDLGVVSAVTARTEREITMKIRKKVLEEAAQRRRYDERFERDAKLQAEANAARGKRKVV